MTESILIRASYSVKFSRFTVVVLIGGNRFALKFDSGAARTVISADRIFPQITDMQRSELEAYCDRKCRRHEFTTASKHQMIGYPVIIRDLQLGAHFNTDFVYYLVPTATDLALLGNDFIDCCGFTHRPHGDILIDEFDDTGYQDYIKGESCIDAIALLEDCVDFLSS